MGAESKDPFSPEIYVRSISMLYSDILLTVDFDRTLTAPDSTIPQRNLDAIAYFMENGGAFTVNTGRSVPMYSSQRDKVSVNVPLLLYNGSAAHTADGQLTNCFIIPTDPKAMIEDIQARFPDLAVELQGEKHHYLFRKDEMWENYCDNNGCPWAYADLDDIPLPFLKLALYEKFTANTVASMYQATPAQLAYFDEVEAYVKQHYAGLVEVFRAAPRIIDIHAKGVSKAAAARQLQKDLGRKILVCVGDAENDLAMLQEADYAFCPSDGIVAARFPNVCPCGEGAVADVIYEKIPEILKNQK